MLELEWTADGQTQTIDFDASITETYEGTADVSEHPVETGANIADNVRAQNETISLEAIVSNHPIVVHSFGMDGASGQTDSAQITVGNSTINASTFQFDQEFDRRQAVDDALRALWKAGQVLTVRTGVREIENCVIARYKVDRAADTGNALSLNMDLKQVRIATSQRVAVAQPAQRRGQQSRNRGSQPAQADNRTAAARLSDAAGSAIRNLGIGL